MTFYHIKKYILDLSLQIMMYVFFKYNMYFYVSLPLAFLHVFYVRVDLQLTATLNSTHTMTPNNQPFRQASRPCKDNTTRQQSRPPTGYCFNYHSQSVGFTAENCPYKQVCPRCKRNHPMYRQCIPPQQQTKITDDICWYRTKSHHSYSSPWPRMWRTPQPRNRMWRTPQPQPRPRVWWRTRPDCNFVFYLFSIWYYVSYI